MHVGILRSGETRSDIFPELQIISKKQFERVERGRIQRSAESERIQIYKSYNRTQHKQRCNGPTTYRAEKVDGVINETICNIFEKVKTINEREFIKQEIQSSVARHTRELELVKGEYARANEETARWEELMLDSIEGNSSFTPQQVRAQLNSCREKADQLLDRITLLQRQINDVPSLAQEIFENHQRLLDWANHYNLMCHAEKKIVASYLIRAVTLTRDYGIQVDFNLSEAQFLSSMTV